MAVNGIISRIADLTKPLIAEQLDHLLVMGDSNGDRFDISVVQNNEPVNLAGGSVTGYFIRIPNGYKTEEGETVAISGTATGNVASVLLPESCYVNPGRFILTIKANSGSTRHAIYVATGVIHRSSTTTYVDPGHVIPDINELLSMITALEQATNDARNVIIPAQNATNAANTAAQSANSAASSANTAATNANAAASKADTATSNANTAASKATSAASDASDAASKANKAASDANAAVTSVNEAKNAANTAATSANDASSKANKAASDANAATSAANAAATNANDAATIAKKWGNVVVTVTMLPNGSNPTCTLTDTTNGKKMAFDIPIGPTGLTPNLTIGTVETGLPGTKVEATMTGTRENPVLNLKIPRGDTGEIENFPYASLLPLPSAKEGSTGTSERVAREDHVHPIPEEVITREELDEELKNLDIPEAPVTSVNGMTGDVDIKIPEYVDLKNYINPNHVYENERVGDQVSGNWVWHAFQLNYDDILDYLKTHDYKASCIFSVDMKLNSGSFREIILEMVVNLPSGTTRVGNFYHVVIPGNSITSSYVRYSLKKDFDFKQYAEEATGLSIRFVTHASESFQVSYKHLQFQLGEIETKWHTSGDFVTEQKLEEELSNLDIPDAPVTSVNEMTGDVILDIPRYFGYDNYIDETTAQRIDVQKTGSSSASLTWGLEEFGLIKENFINLVSSFEDEYVYLTVSVDVDARDNNFDGLACYIASKNPNSVVSYFSQRSTNLDGIKKLALGKQRLHFKQKIKKKELLYDGEIYGLSGGFIFNNIISDGVTPLPQRSADFTISNPSLRIGFIVDDPIVNDVHFGDPYSGVDLTVKYASEISREDPWSWIKSRITNTDYSGIHVGDYIPFECTNGVKLNAQIVGIDTYYQLGSDVNRVPHHIDFICRELWPTTTRMHSSDFNNGTSTEKAPYLCSDMYYYLNSLKGTLQNESDTTSVDYTNSGVYYFLPVELKECILDKYGFATLRYNSTSVSKNDTGREWKNFGHLWLPNEFEITGQNIINDSKFERIWSFHYPFFNSTSARIRKASDSSSSYRSWWTSSAANGYSTDYVLIGNDGTLSQRTASGNLYFPVCFRIG